MNLFLISLIILFCLASWIDFKSFILPNWITLPLMVIGLVFNLINIQNLCSWQDSVLGLVIGYGFIRLIDFIYLHLRGQHGIGQGDAKLLGAIGAILGYQMVFPILLMASVLGLIYGLIMNRNTIEKMRQAIPFGPFLSIVTCVIIASKLSF
jgi:prepilin signal peptidase PulO-like enzyme (type II secretory pathway)